jgi:predicted nucleic acid-binding protein
VKVLFDTNVLVAAVLPTHAFHQSAKVWLEAAVTRRIELYVSCHTLAEMYRVLSAMTLTPARSTQDIHALFEQDIYPCATVVELTFADYQTVLQRVSRQNLRSGIVFDALIMQAALKAGVDKLLTLNSKHFEPLWPNHTDQVISPLTTQVP